MVNLCVMLRKVRLVLMAVSFGVPGWASAAEIQWIPGQDKAGFTVIMPSINMDTQVDEIAALKIALKHDEELLARRVEEKRITSNDKMLTVFMPGGMLYAAYKKSAYDRAVREHELVSSRLKEITTDLATLTAINGPVVVAQR